jgi:hypothetical protein
MKEYLDTANVPELTAEEIELIESTGAQRHQKFFVCSIDQRDCYRTNDNPLVMGYDDKIFIQIQVATPANVTSSLHHPEHRMVEKVA